MRKEIENFEINTEIMLLTNLQEFENVLKIMIFLNFAWNSKSFKVAEMLCYSRICMQF